MNEQELLEKIKENSTFLSCLSMAEQMKALQCALATAGYKNPEVKIKEE